MSADGSAALSIDEADVSESWTLPGKVEDALAVAADFDPVVKAVISSTPAGTFDLG